MTRLLSLFAKRRSAARSADAASPSAMITVTASVSWGQVRISMSASTVRTMHTGPRRFAALSMALLAAVDVSAAGS